MNEVKVEKLVIVGQTASGKDFLLKYMIEKKLSYFPKYTTRPIRQGENDGVEYKFISNELFVDMLSEGKIKFHQEFQIGSEIWMYGISKDDYEKGQLFIMTPHEIGQMSDGDRKECFIVYLDIDESIRRQRLSQRNDSNDSIDRRIIADKSDFMEFDTWDLKITDSEFESEIIWSLMC